MYVSHASLVLVWAQDCGSDYVCLKSTRLLNCNKEKNSFIPMFAPEDDITHTHFPSTANNTQTQRPIVKWYPNQLLIDYTDVGGNERKTTKQNEEVAL